MAAATEDLRAWDALVRRLGLAYSLAFFVGGLEQFDPPVRLVVLRQIALDCTAMAGHARELAAEAELEAAGDALGGAAGSGRAASDGGVATRGDQPTRQGEGVAWWERPPTP